MGEKFGSIVDLLDAFFGASWAADTVDRLSGDDLDALATDVNNFYSGYEVPAPKSDLLRTYSGGATFAANMKTVESAGVHLVPHSQLLPFAHSAALYVDQIVVDCPLDSWIFDYRDFLIPGSYRGLSGMEITPLGLENSYGAGFHGSSNEENRIYIKEAIRRLDVLKPAIRQGWVITVPHLRVWKSMAESVRAQVRRDVMNPKLLGVLTSNFETPPAQSDNMRGMGVMPSEGVIVKDHARSIIESPMIYFNSALAVAGAVNSRFLPTADSDFSLLRQKIDDVGKLNRQIRDGISVGSLRRVLAPVFDEAKFATVCEIRNSEDSFNDWRNEIRKLSDEGSPIRENEMLEYESIMDERLGRLVQNIESDIEKSRTLRGRINAVKPSKLDIGLAAVVWALPPQGSALKLIAGVGAPILKAALSSISATHKSANSVIMKLQRTS